MPEPRLWTRTGPRAAVPNVMYDVPPVRTASDGSAARCSSRAEMVARLLADHDFSPLVSRER